MYSIRSQILVLSQIFYLSRGRIMIWLLTQPHSRQQAEPATHRKTEKQRQVADRRGGEGGGRVAESYGHKNKAWSSINHQILSGLHKLRTESLREKLEEAQLCFYSRSYHGLIDYSIHQVKFGFPSPSSRLFNHKYAAEVPRR
jgi:hypothetical protein